MSRCSGLVHHLVAVLLVAPLAGTATARPAAPSQPHAHNAPHVTKSQARAPRLDGLGTLHMPVSTSDERAQEFFDQGLRLLYAFNHAESRRAFEEASRLDPALAMAYWGQAMTLAVNLNAPMSAESGRLAYRVARRASRLASRATGVERALIAALVSRFAPDGRAARPPLDAAYADAMARAAREFPDHPDVQVLAADARMNTMAWDYWQKDGTLKPGAEDIRAALERVIASQPDHAGAHHYYIHLMEGSRTPEAAEASADRLGTMMPAAGHMVHMPAHIYLRVGRYADAAEANIRAIAADEDYLAQCQAQGLYPIAYYPHNLHFLWAAATLEGRGDVAVDAARQVAAKVPHHHAGAVGWTADFPVTPWLAYVRFGRWSQMLTEPRPPSHEPYATAIWHYGRGLAFVARGDLGRARQELAVLDGLTGHEAFRTTLKGTPLATNLAIARRIVAAEIASREGHHEEAVTLASAATVLEDSLPYNEPPVWHQPTRQVLGALLLAAGRAAEAEAAYRQDLAQVRENGWSLFGLWQSLEAQSRTAEAVEVRRRFETAWKRADVVLAASRIMAPATRAGAAGFAVDGSRADERAQEGVMQTFIEVDTGVRLEYVEQGAADGIPVILLHGVTDSWRSFETVLPHLPRTVRALAISQRGHGASDRPPRGYRYQHMSEDLRAFMDALGLPSAIIVGHSMGSMVAQRFAIDHPDRVSGLVLMGAFPTLHEDAGISDFFRTQVAPLRDPIDPVFAREWQLSTVARAMPAAHLDTIVEETLKVPARVWHETFEGFLATTDFSEGLRRVTVPALVTWGDRDTYATRDAQERLLDVLPHARFIVFEGAGHAMHWEDPGAFARHLTEFIYEPR